MTLRRLVLWRHGQTEYNVTKRIQGHLDIPLTATGREQARRAAPVIAAFEPDVGLSSDLSRATTTAAAFTALTGMPMNTDKRLREVLFGEWQGLDRNELDQSWPGGMTAWSDDPAYGPPGGESQVELAARAVEVVQELDLAQDGTALLCAHGGLIRVLTASLLGLPTQLWAGIGGIQNCHWVLLGRSADGDRRWRLLTYNGGFPE